MALPEKKFRVGSVTATIWKNTNKVDGKEVSFYTVALERSYKDKEDNWKTTNSLRSSDLPKAILVASKAYEFLELKDEVIQAKAPQAPKQAGGETV